MRQRCAQLLFRNHREAVNAGMNQKTFEAEHARAGEFFYVTLIVGNHAAPRRPIHSASAARRVALRFERSHITGSRQAIQWHVHEHRVAAGCRRARRRLESLPLSSSGIIDVHVRIHKPGKNRRLAEILNSRARWNLIRGNDGSDLLAVNQNSRRTNSVRRNHASREQSL